MINKKASFKVLAGWLIDGTGGPVKRHAVMDISDGIISSVGYNIQYSIDAEKMIDFSHCTVLPGLVDSHVHLGMSGNIDPDVRKRQLEMDYQDVKDVISRHLDDHLENGIVAVRDGGDRGGHSLQYKHDNLREEPSAVDFHVAGKAWHAAGRYGELIGRSPFKGQDMGQAVKEACDGIDHIKIVNSGLNSLTHFAKETPPQFSLGQLRKAVKQANDLGLKVMVHANGEKAVRDAIDAGCHSIEHGFFMGRENLSLLAEKEIAWIPTAITMKAYSEIFNDGSIEGDIARRNFEHQVDQINIAQKNGVRISVGTDSGSPGVHHGQAVREEVTILLEAGLSVEKAIQCATLNSAELLGIGSSSGSLVKGKHATFMVVPGLPDELSWSLGHPAVIYIKGMKYMV